MHTQPDDLVARILAENEKIDQLKTILNTVQQELAEGDRQLRLAREKLGQDEYNDALPHAIAARAHYEMAISSAQQVNQAAESSDDVGKLIKEAFDMLQKGSSALAQAKQVQFMIEDLKGLQTDLKDELAAENWALVGQYAADALKSYPDSHWFSYYVELAQNKVAQKQPGKAPWFDALFRRRS